MRALIVCSLLALSACQSVQHATLSGKPEVTVAAPADQAKTAFVGALINSGFSLKSDTQFMVVAERVTTGLGAALLATQYDSRVMARITGTFVPNGKDTRVVADMALVSNPGSAFERPFTMTASQDSIRVQQMLDGIRDGFAARKLPGQIAVETAAIFSVGRQAAN